MQSVVTAVTLVCTVILQYCHYHRCWTVVNYIDDTLMLSCHRCHSAVSCYRCHTSVHSNVTVLSLSSLLSGCQLHRWHTNVELPSLSQCCLGHCCNSTVKYTAITVLSLPPMPNKWPTAVPLVKTAAWQLCKPQPLCHRCGIPPL